MDKHGMEGKRAIVTGASSGIGRATALRLVRQGGVVLATGRNHEALDALVEKATEQLPLATISGDLTDEAFRKSLIETATEELGGIDILVNAAGIIGNGDWKTTGLDDYDQMMDINLRTVFALTQLALPSLIEAKGSIVNVSSVTGTRAFPGVLAYCVSKAGLDQLTRCLALELASDGVRVNSVNPGVVETNLHRNGGMDEEAYASFLQHSKTTHPLGRIGQPEEIAALITFLASEEAGWITGANLPIDGGRHQTCAR